MIAPEAKPDSIRNQDHRNLTESETKIIKTRLLNQDLQNPTASDQGRISSGTAQHHLFEQETTW